MRIRRIFNTRFFQTYRTFPSSQQGFSSLIIILLLAAAILLGVYLVQNRTNIFPFAAENDSVEVTPPTLSGTYQEPKDDKKIILQDFISNSDKGSIFCSGNKLQVRPKTSVSQPLNSTAQTIIDCNTFGPNTDGFKCGKTAENKYGCIKPSGTGSGSGSGSGGTTTSPSNSKAKERNVSVLSGAFPKGDPGDFIPRSDKQEILNQYLNGKIAGTIECRNSNAQSNDGKNTGDAEKNASSLWVVPDNPTKDTPAQYIIDCSKSAIGSYKNWESVKCGKLKSGSSFQYGCVDTSLKSSTDGSVKSPTEDYSSNKTKSDCEKAAKKEYCNDSGKFVSEKPVWQSNRCQSEVSILRDCSTTDKYKNGQGYTGPQDGVVAANKPIIDNKISPELEKLATDCGMKADTNNSLGIPFFKIATGQNLSVNREDCKQLLKNQLTYFEQANKDAARKLMEQAEKLGVGVIKKDDGTYALSDGADTSKTGVKELSESVAKLNEAQKAIADCQKKTGNDQAACLEGTQKKTQTAATAAQAAALQGYVAKFDAVVSGDLPEGKEEMCVKADLGVSPFMDAEGINHEGEEYRLLVCRKKGENKVKWRVLVGGLATGETSKNSDNEEVVGGEGDATDSNNKTDACGNNKDCGNDAERLAKLHPTGSGDPVFPVKINTCVTLTSNDPTKVKEILAPYYNAAKAGTTNVSSQCQRIKNPNDTGGNGSSRRAGQTSTTGSSASSGSGSSSSSSSSSGSSTSQNNSKGFRREGDTIIYSSGRENCRLARSCSGDTGCCEGFRCNKPANGQPGTCVEK